MKQTSVIEKQSFINNVIKILEKNEKEREIKLIKKQNDLTKKYKRAQSFVREYKPIFDGENLYKSNDIILEKNDKGLYDNDIVGETDDKFISEIQKHDKSIDRRNKLIKTEKDSISHLMRLFFGETSFKIKREFIDKLDIDKVLVGYKNGNEVYYSEEFNSLYEIV